MESGLSVSVESSPRTPPTWSVSESQSPVGNGGAPLKKGIRNLDNEILRGDDGCDDGCEESISPRGVLWEPKRSVAARRLDFSSEELSPIPAVAATADSSIIASEEDTVGDCGVCYLSLPLRSNHVFTVCGHLFCVNCFLTWWDIAINCPLCRANLFVVDDNPNHNLLDNGGGDIVSE
jgi:hypothetical protein